MRNSLLVAGSIVVALALASVASAKQGASSQPDKKHAKQAYKNLHLTDAQKAQIKAIRERAKADAKKASTKQEKLAIQNAAEEKIRKEVLTEDQRKQLEASQKAGHQGHKHQVEQAKHDKAAAG